MAEDVVCFDRLCQMEERMTMLRCGSRADEIVIVRPAPDGP
ncbi:hypothetical protein Q2941_38500 [Bradyrhizobium sp. UFLA05-153]